MRKLLFVLTILFVAGPLQSQWKGIKFFKNIDIDSINSITVVTRYKDPLGLNSKLTFELARIGLKTLSQSAAKRRLIDFENNLTSSSQNIAVNNGSLILKSDLVMTFQYSYKEVQNRGYYNNNPDGAYNSLITDLNIEIINLSKDGEVVAGAMYSKGSGLKDYGRMPAGLVEDIGYLIEKNLTKNFERNKEKAKKQLIELKELLDLGIITQKEFKKKSASLKKIILNN